MDEGLRNAIHDMTLQARALLTTEARELLEGTYGLDANGALAPWSKNILYVRRMTVRTAWMQTAR